MTEDLVTRGEIAGWLTSLLKHFEMDHGYPSTYVMTMDGPEHGVVGDELGAILEQGLELLGAIREELGEDDESEFDDEYEIEWEFFGAENVADEEES